VTAHIALRIAIGIISAETVLLFFFTVVTAGEWTKVRDYILAIHAVAAVLGCVLLAIMGLDYAFTGAL